MSKTRGKLRPGETITLESGTSEASPLSSNPPYDKTNHAVVKNPPENRPDSESPSKPLSHDELDNKHEMNNERELDNKHELGNKREMGNERKLDNKHELKKENNSKKPRGLGNLDFIEKRRPSFESAKLLEIVARTDHNTMIVRPLLNQGSGEDSMSFLESVGQVPIPPYIRGGRMVEEDRENYQTVYAKEPGAVAAPTAGLHFTDELLARIRQRGVSICPVTLHVGIGTFKPIMVSHLEEHHMHSEFATLSAETVRQIQACKKRGGRVFAIGTTSVRTLESASNCDEHGKIDSSGNNAFSLRPFCGDTDLFIRPPYRFKTVDALLTNFHLPKSTLLVLVRTFGGDELLQRAYREAIEQQYRFYSYGDAMVIL